MDAAFISSTFESFGLPEFVITFFASHPYEIIFICLLIGAGVVLFPAFYLATVGVLNGWVILLVMILAGLVADSFWYLVGRGLLPRFIESRIEKGKYLKKLTDITEGKELVYLFYSKFIYGTRIATQILCGARKVYYGGFLGVSAVSVTLLGGIYYMLIRFTSAGIDSLGDLKYKLFIVLVTTMVIVGSIHYLVYRLFKKKLFN